MVTMEKKAKSFEDTFVQVCEQISWIQEFEFRHGSYSDITLKESRAVVVIAETEQPTARRIADCLNLSPGTLTITADRLVRKGYVDRARDAKDRRIVHIFLTDRGRELYKKYRTLQQQAYKKLVAGMSAEQVSVLQRGFENLFAHYDAEQQKSKPE